MLYRVVDDAKSKLTKLDLHDKFNSYTKFWSKNDEDKSFVRIILECGIHIYILFGDFACTTDNKKEKGERVSREKIR